MLVLKNKKKEKKKFKKENKPSGLRLIHDGSAK